MAVDDGDDYARTRTYRAQVGDVYNVLLVMLNNNEYFTLMEADDNGRTAVCRANNGGMNYRIVVEDRGNRGCSVSIDPLASSADGAAEWITSDIESLFDGLLAVLQHFNVIEQAHPTRAASLDGRQNAQPGAADGPAEAGSPSGTQPGMPESFTPRKKHQRPQPQNQNPVVSQQASLQPIGQQASPQYGDGDAAQGQAGAPRRVTASYGMSMNDSVGYNAAGYNDAIDQPIEFADEQPEPAPEQVEEEPAEQFGSLNLISGYGSDDDGRPFAAEAGKLGAIKQKVASNRIVSFFYDDDSLFMGDSSASSVVNEIASSVSTVNQGTERMAALTVGYGLVTLMYLAIALATPHLGGIPILVLFIVPFVCTLLNLAVALCYPEEGRGLVGKIITIVFAVLFLVAFIASF